MENNDQQIEVSKLVEFEAVETLMQRNLASSLRTSNFKCSIYKVPEFIRKGKEECYRPSVISIGPVFYNDSHLQTMQQLKWIYYESFLKLPDNACPSPDRYINIVRNIDRKIRDCYEEQSMILCDDNEFIQMIVLDAVFLLSQLIQSDNLPRVPKKLRALESFIEKDIFLMENQIPFFVLKLIFDEAFPKSTVTLIDHIRTFLGKFNIPGAKHETILDDMGDASNNIVHLLDFWWKYCCLSFKKHKGEQEVAVADVATTNKPRIIVDLWRRCWCCLEQDHEMFPVSAKQLIAAGVKFKKIETNNPLNITFDKEHGELLIPKLTLMDNTEALLRNILFFEQSHILGEEHTYFTDWVIFLDELIDNVEDIQILQQNRILDNQIGYDEEVADIFNKITKNLCYSCFFYSDVGRDVNAYANKPWNQWKAILRRDYFNHPWAIISFIFAIIVFVLTILQTITGFKKN